MGYPAVRVPVRQRRISPVSLSSSGSNSSSTRFKSGSDFRYVYLGRVASSCWNQLRRHCWQFTVLKQIERYRSCRVSVVSAQHDPPCRTSGVQTQIANGIQG
eukprot:jgi/Botrbrau1/21140/Bobra.0061s0034.1